MKDITVFTERPCQDALDWLEIQTSLASAWDNCPRGDWLWWAVQHMDGKMPTKGQSVQYARWCAKRASDYADAANEAAENAYAAAYAADAAAAYYAAAYAAAAAAAAAAHAAADAYYAAADAYADEKQAQAEWIREHISNPFKE